MKMKVMTFVIAVALFVMWYLVLSTYLDLPTVEMSIETNACVRAYGPKGPIPCAEAMEMSHEVIYVDDSQEHSDKAL